MRKHQKLKLGVIKREWKAAKKETSQLASWAVLDGKHEQSDH